MALHPPTLDMVPMSCKHKYSFARNESYWYVSGRYSNTYVSIDHFFCEKCLDAQTKKNSITVADAYQDSLPDWAKAITKKISSPYSF